MEKLTLQQIHDLREVQEELIFSKNVHLEFYRKLAKRTYTDELNNLIRGEFNRVEIELNIPKLPPRSTVEEEYTPMLQLDEIVELYDAMNESLF